MTPAVLIGAAAFVTALALRPRKAHGDASWGALDPAFAHRLRVVFADLKRRGWKPTIVRDTGGWRNHPLQRKLVGKGASKTMRSYHRTARAGRPAAMAADVIDARYGWTGPRATAFFAALDAAARRAGLYTGRSFNDHAHVQAGPPRTPAPRVRLGGLADLFGPSTKEKRRMARVRRLQERRARIAASIVSQYGHLIRANGGDPEAVALDLVTEVEDLGIDPLGLAAVINNESDWNPRAVNGAAAGRGTRGSAAWFARIRSKRYTGAVGLTQFTGTTAAELLDYVPASRTTQGYPRYTMDQQNEALAAIYAMDYADQLHLVAKNLARWQRILGPLDSLHKIAMAVFFPSAVRKAGDWTLPAYVHQHGITEPGHYVAKVRAHAPGATSVRELRA